MIPLRHVKAESTNTTKESSKPSIHANLNCFLIYITCVYVCAVSGFQKKMFILTFLISKIAKVLPL